MVIISDVVTVLDKNIKDGVTRDNKPTKFFNIRVGGMGFSNTVGVPEEVYNAVNVGDDIRLQGSAGFTRDGGRFWFFDNLYLGK